MSYFAKKDVKNMNVFLLFLGVRQEQDIYVRLIDSVTKQVKYLLYCIFLNSLLGISVGSKNQILTRVGFQEDWKEICAFLAFEVWTFN